MIRRIFENYENRQLKKRLAIVTKRIAELEAQLAEYQPRFKVGDIVQNYGRAVAVEQVYENSRVHFSYGVKPVGEDWKEIISQHELQPLTTPKPVICDNCHSEIEGKIHVRYGLHAEYSLCGACVTENED